MSISNAQSKVLQLHPDDNVWVALQDLKDGDEVFVGDKKIVLTENILAKHKFAIRDFQLNDQVKMYGVVIGKAMRAIKTGEALSTQNLKHDVKPYEVRAVENHWKKLDVSSWKSAIFQGYHRDDGQVGTRNYWLVVPLVFCENRNVEYIKNAFIKKLGYAKPDKYEGYVEQLIKQYRKNGTNFSDEKMTVEADVATEERVFKNIDGIKFLMHQGGCGGTREDSTNLCKLIAGYINNPNVAGATILSLGCQHAQIAMLKEAMDNIEGIKKPTLFYEQQKFSSEEALLKQAILETFNLLIDANAIERKPAALNKLCIGLKCGGSDGFSGITANPAMGHVSDLLASLGGKTILAEFPELCGVEQELVDRSTSLDIAKKFASLMTEYNSKAEAIGSGFSMNPSPGNIKDGLITDAMKSAGAAKKGGSSPVADVLNYGEYITHAGLNLLCTPGNDVEATTGMAGSGATLIIFSTGLGTPTGNPIAPVVKTSTNTSLAKRLGDLIDFDHGDIITAGKSIEQSGEELLKLIIKIASGEVLTKAEQLQQDDFIPWKRGVSL